ncbi:unnamed protein product [Calicophoron daubneyi]|uniref:Acyltransferase n=2 Tax=Calicophoron daubneyi TaxID=300641 RepID=A0AAV2T2Q0_CALDB
MIESMLMFSLANSFWLSQLCLPAWMFTALLYSGPRQLLRSKVFAVLVCYYVFCWVIDRNRKARVVYFDKRLRYAGFWRKLFSYFPVRMILSDELVDYSHRVQNHLTDSELTKSGDACKFPGLPTDRNYILGYHPHGLFCWGAAACFATESVGFSKIFPGLNPSCAILPSTFKMPLLRELMLSLGSISANYDEMRYRLDSTLSGETGNLTVLVIGGMNEMVGGGSGRFTLYINRRYGFCKLALQTGTSLIPCLSFGDTKTYGLYIARRGTFFRRIQDYLYLRLGIPFFLCYGIGLAPFRTPIYVVVGAPIPTERISNPTRDQVAELKARYVESLRNLFNQYKKYFGFGAEELELI